MERRGHQHRGGGHPKWHFQTEGPIWSSPTVAENKVYFGSGDGCVYAVDRRTGKTKWEYQTGGPIKSSPFVTNKTVYIGSNDERIYALDAESGNIEWEFATEAAVRSSPTVADDTVYVGSNDANIYAINADTGEKVWNYETGHEVYSSAVATGETIYIASKDDHIYALNQDNGDEEWKYRTNGRIESSPTVRNNSVLIGSYDGGTVYSFDADSGKKRWEHNTEGRIKSSPTVTQNIVFYGTTNGLIQAVDVESKTKKWEIKKEDGIYASPTVVDRTIFFVDYNGGIYAIDMLSGEERWNCEIDGKVSSSPTAVDGILYVGSRGDEEIHAISIKSGSSSGSRVLNRVLGHHNKKESHVGRGVVEESLKRGQKAIQMAEEASVNEKYEKEVSHLEDALSEFNNAWERAKQDQSDQDGSKIKPKIEDTKESLELAKKSKARKEISSAVECANKSITEGNERYNEEDYESAEESFRNAKEKLSTASEIAKQYDIDQIDKINNKIEKTTDSIKNCQVSQFDNSINKNKALIQNNQFNQAKENLSDLFQEIKSAEIPTSDRDKLIDKARSARVDAQLENAKLRMEEAREEMDSEEYDTAYTKFEKIKDDLENLLEEAASEGLDKKQTEINKLIDDCSDMGSKARRKLYKGIQPRSAESSNIKIKSPETDIAASDQSSENTLSVDGVDQEEPDTGAGTPPKLERIEKIGEGGMASVYKVRLEKSGEVAALKEIDFKGTLHMYKIKEFVREAKTWNSVDNHNNIVSIKEWGASGKPWLLMEYIEGGDLRSSMADVEIVDSIRILDGIVEALIHAGSINHCDIKPENILLQQDNSPKLADWGLARIQSEDSTINNTVGTEGYRAPEQFNDGSIDQRTDIYQLGVTAYEMFTGEFPFDNKSQGNQQDNIVEKKLTPPSTLDPEIPSEVDELISNCLYNDKSERFDSHTELKDSLEDILNETV